MFLSLQVEGWSGLFMDRVHLVLEDSQGIVTGLLEQSITCSGNLIIILKYLQMELVLYFCCIVFSDKPIGGSNLRAIVEHSGYHSRTV